MPANEPTRFTLLVYRVPARPTANRVYVWRMLKKAGAVYLQQSVTVFPQNRQVTNDLRAILKKIDDSGGEYYLLPLRQLPAAERDKLVAQFLDQTARHYQEIIENCEVNFTKEIEFETFRGNLTYEEAEEIRSEYDKIVSWFARVRERDWFGAPNRSEAEDWLRRSGRLLEEFEAKVYRTQLSTPEDGTKPARPRARVTSRRGRAKGRKTAKRTAPRRTTASGTSALDTTREHQTSSADEQHEDG